MTGRQPPLPDYIRKCNNSLIWLKVKVQKSDVHTMFIYSAIDFKRDVKKKLKKKANISKSALFKDPVNIDG